MGSTGAGVENQLRVSRRLVRGGYGLRPRSNCGQNPLGATQPAGSRSSFEVDQNRYSVGWSVRIGQNGTWEPSTGARCSGGVRKLWTAVALVAVGSACASAALGSTEKEGAWRLAFATESEGSRGLDIYVASVPGGKPVRVAGTAGRDDFSPAWSPDGRLIAYRRNPARSDDSDILVVRASGGTPTNLTRSPGVADWSPAWSPSGRRLAYFSMQGGGRDLWVMNRDGTGKRRLTRDGSLNEYPSWSPNGGRIVFQTTRAGEFEIFVMSSRGRAPRNISRHPARDQWADWSPDGKWIAFMSTRDGNEDVFVMRPDGTEVRNLTGTRDLEESHPSWSPTGEITFTRHGESGPVELWAIQPDGSGLRRLETRVEPVFAYDWATGVESGG